MMNVPGDFCRGELLHKSITDYRYSRAFSLKLAASLIRRCRPGLHISKIMLASTYRFSRALRLQQIKNNSLYRYKEKHMKNPLDSLWGTVISGLILTVVLYVLIKNFLGS
jgi:hypothetical protein